MRCFQTLRSSPYPRFGRSWHREWKEVCFVAGGTGVEAGSRGTIPRLSAYIRNKALGASVSLIAHRSALPLGTWCQQMDIWKLILEGSECLASPQALAREARVPFPPGGERIECGAAVSPHLDCGASPASAGRGKTTARSRSIHLQPLPLRATLCFAVAFSRCSWGTVSAGGAAAVPLPTPPAPGCHLPHAGVSPRQLPRCQGSPVLHHGAEAEAILAYRGTGEIRTKKRRRSLAGAGLRWCGQRSCRLSLAGRKLRALCRQQRAGCQRHLALMAFGLGSSPAHTLPFTLQAQLNSSTLQLGLDRWENKSGRCGSPFLDCGSSRVAGWQEGSPLAAVRERHALSQGYVGPYHHVSTDRLPPGCTGHHPLL